VEKSHYVVVDYDIRREGKPIAGGGGRQELVDMSADQSIAGLSEGLVGAKVGESREFPVQHEGRPAVCSVRVVEIKEKVLPALDDDFAKDVGAESLQALKARLQEIAAREAEERSERDLVRQMESALLESNKFPVPPALVESQLDLMLDRISSRLGPKGIPEAEMESLRGKLRPRSEEEVRLGFILSFVARKEGVEISDEDVEKEFQENLQDARTDEQRRDVREFFDKRRESIAGALRDRRVMALLRSSARISEVPA
jgi:trigger factor